MPVSIQTLHLVDNASTVNPYVRVATWKDGVWDIKVRKVPEWAAQVMG